MINSLTNSRYFFFIAVCLLFILFLSLFHSSFNSDDDIYFLYTLSGGYGFAPSNLLHYAFSWNPLISWPVKQLFSSFPKVNWYTVYLLAFHLASSIQIARLLELMYSRKTAFFAFVIFFLFIESRLLLSLNYSGTSLVLCISGLSSLIYYHQSEKRKYLLSPQLLLPALLILLGGWMRPHMLALCILVTLSSTIFLLPFSQYKMLFVQLLLAGLIVWASAIGHHYYYSKSITGWQEEENFRQAMFHLYNKPLKPVESRDSSAIIKNSFIQKTFLYDTAFAARQDIEVYTKDAIGKKTTFNSSVRKSLYWMFMELRVYGLLASIMLLGLLFASDSKIARKWLWQCLPPILLFCFLFLFFKITESIFLALFSSMFFSAIFTGKEVTFKSRTKTLLLYILLFFCCAWMLKRLVSMDSRNKQNITRSRSAIQGLAAHKSLIFISSENLFPLNLSIWDTPACYPLENFINKELVLTNSHKRILARHNINSLADALPRRNDIILIGNTLPLLKEYYRTWQGINVEIKQGERLASMNTYQIILASGK